jgi:hypothetical protein
MRRTLLIRHHAERWHDHRRGLHHGWIARARETYLVGCVGVVQQACAATGMPRLRAVVPTLVDLAEDGGTARDKAVRVQALAAVARERSLTLCAVVDGKGGRSAPAR